MDKTEWHLEQRLFELLENDRRLRDESLRQRESARSMRSNLRAAVLASRRLTGRGGPSTAADDLLAD